MNTLPTPPGIRAEELATLTGASLRTARRWKSCGAMPAGFAVAVALLQNGDLGVIAQEWRGWRLRRGELVNPDGWTFRPGEVTALPILQQLAREQRRQLAQPAQLALV